ncbi:MAG: ATP-binding protein [Gammaproteobacteria bacterium]|nr:ATP-binding protein [Gammaproteobacteria bacterium]
MTILKSGTVITTPEASRVRKKYADQADDSLMAIKEILDNMVLAGAKKVFIDSVIDKDRRLFMTFRDDGHGLEMSHLQEALKPYGTSDGSGGNENGIGGFGSLTLLGDFVHLRTRHANDGFAYEVTDISLDVVSWQEIPTVDSQPFYEIKLANCFSYNTRAEKNIWRKIADIFSNHIADGLVIEPRYFDTSGSPITKHFNHKLYSPPMQFQYPKGSISTIKHYSDTTLGVKVSIETKVLDPTHHVRTHAVPCTSGGMRIYVMQDGIRTVWDRNQQELAKKWRGKPNHPQLNSVCIYIDFTKGRCKAKPIKNQLIKSDPVFSWLQDKIKEHLDNDVGLQPFITVMKPEEQIEQNLSTSLLPIMGHSNILRQQPDGFDGNMDIISEDGSIKCVWEIKAVKFDHKAVSQMYWYLTQAGRDRAYAVGVGFTPPAIAMITHLQATGHDVKMIDLTDPRYSHYLP